MKDSGFTRWYAVVTADQRASRTSPDRVPAALAALTGLPCVLGPARSAGDEVQLLLDDPAALTACLAALLRLGDWHVGVGFGEVEHPLPDDVRAARGPAFVAARAAVEASRGQASSVAMAIPAGPVPTGPVGARDYAGDDDPAEGRHLAVQQAHAVAALLGFVWARRSREGWDVVDQVEQGASGREAAERLGISPSAVSQRLRAAGWQADALGRDALTSLVATALAPEELA